MSEKRNKQYTCKWEPNCDDDYRRPYGNCPDNCPNYKENKSVEELEKENAELKEQIEKMKCCGNCKFQENGMYYELGELCYRCEAFSNWELPE